jgi:hypothetical protein
VYYNYIYTQNVSLLVGHTSIAHSRGHLERKGTLQTIHPLHNFFNLSTSILQQWTKNKFSIQWNELLSASTFSTESKFCSVSVNVTSECVAFCFLSSSNCDSPLYHMLPHFWLTTGIQTRLHTTPQRNIWQASFRWPCLPCYTYTSSYPSYLELSVQVIHNLCKSGNVPSCSNHICILAAGSASPKFGGRSFSSKFSSQAAVKLFSTKWGPSKECVTTTHCLFAKNYGGHYFVLLYVDFTVSKGVISLCGSYWHV